MAEIQNAIGTILGNNDCNCHDDQTCNYCDALTKGEFLIPQFRRYLSILNREMTPYEPFIFDFRVGVQNVIIFEKKYCRPVAFTIYSRRGDSQNVRLMVFKKIRSFNDVDVNFFCERLESKSMEFMLQSFVGELCPIMQKFISTAVERNISIPDNYFLSMIRSLGGAISGITYPNIIQLLDKKNLIRPSSLSISRNNKCYAAILCCPETLVKYCHDRQFQLNFLIQITGQEIHGWTIKSYFASLGYLKVLIEKQLVIAEILSSKLSIVNSAIDLVGISH